MRLQETNFAANYRRLIEGRPRGVRVPDPRIVVLSGGLGGARMALALSESGLADRATFITNVDDDVDIERYLICPTPMPSSTR